MSRCSICYTMLRPDEAATSCPDCHAAYHATCWSEVGGCGTYGCRSAAVAHKPPPPVVVGAGWGDSKDCPACGKAIGASLLVCGCGARFPWADPMTAAEYAAHVASQRRQRRARRVLVSLFVASLTVIAAPVTGAVAGVYAHRRRDELAGSGGTYVAMGYGSAAIGAIFAALAALVALGL